MDQVRSLKYLFLDIDGVANSSGHIRRAGSDWSWKDLIDPLNVAQINVIIEEVPEVRVVLSSAWRLYPGKEVALDALRNAGYKGTILGVTPDHSTQVGHGRRGQEIAAYVSTHNIEEEEICILDDDTDIDPLKHRWVRTFDFEGLTPKGAAQAIDMLKGKL